MFAIVRDDMPVNRDKIIFSVRDSERFPGETWRAFRAACDRRGEAWIDVLRRLIEQYTKAPPEQRP